MLQMRGGRGGNQRLRKIPTRIGRVRLLATLIFGVRYDGRNEKGKRSMNVEIARRLAARRKQAGLSQEALAERLGVSRQAVSKWERSESSPDTDNLIALAQLYGVSLDDLLYVDDDIKDDVSFEAACRAAERRDEVRPHGGGAVGACGAGGMGVGAAGVGGAGGAAGGAASGTASTGACGASAVPGTAATDVAPDAVPRTAEVKIGPGGIHVLDGGDYVHVSWREGVRVHDGSRGDEVHVGWDGVRVREGRVGAKGAGFAAADGEGNEVQVDREGVTINGEHFDSWREERAHYGRGHARKGRTRERSRRNDAGHWSESRWDGEGRWDGSGHWGGESRWSEPCGYTVRGEYFDTLDEARKKYGDGVGTDIPVRKHYLGAFGRAWVKFPFPLVAILGYLLLGIFCDAWGTGLFLFFAIPLYYLVGSAIGRRRIAPFVSAAYPLGVVAWFCYMAFVLNQPHPAWVAFLTIPLVEWLVVSLSHGWSARRCRKEATSAPIEVESADPAAEPPAADPAASQVAKHPAAEPAGSQVAKPADPGDPQASKPVGSPTDEPAEPAGPQAAGFVAPRAADPVGSQTAEPARLVEPAKPQAACRAEAAGSTGNGGAQGDAAR